MKNISRLKRVMNETKGKLQQKFPILTNGYLVLLTGKPEEMLVRAQVKLTETKEEIHKLTV